MHHEFILPLSYRSAATRLAIAFVLWSALWVVTSDYFLHFLFGPRLDLWRLETEKGLIYVAVSGVLLWFSVRAMERDEAARRVANESKLRSLKESGLIGVSSWGEDGKITYVNETLAQMLDYGEPEIIGTDGKQYIPAEYDEAYRRAELELHLCGRTSIHELQLIRKDAARVPVLSGRALVEGADIAPPSETRPTGNGLWRGSGTVLLVDDEASVRESTSNLLSALGFRVLLAENGEQGLNTFTTHVKDIVAVILDLTMPRLSGGEVFEQIRKVCPQLPVLLSSGYNEENTMERFTGKGLAGFLQKPFSLNDLSAKLQECLNAA